MVVLSSIEPPLGASLDSRSVMSRASALKPICSRVGWSLAQPPSWVSRPLVSMTETTRLRPILRAWAAVAARAKEPSVSFAAKP